MLRQRFAREWQMAPFDIPGPNDWEHELFDERGRQIEIWLLEEQYPLG
jgi:cell division FtsZ-interacting protein ZapD